MVLKPNCLYKTADEIVFYWGEDFSFIFLEANSIVFVIKIIKTNKFTVKILYKDKIGYIDIEVHHSKFLRELK